MTEVHKVRGAALWVSMGLAMLILLQFGAATWVGLLENTNSNGGDQGAYLVLGLEIREGRALTDGNRHPLYPLLISAFAQREWSYFTLSKLISLLIGIGALAGVIAVGWRLGGPTLGLSAGAALGLNAEFLAQTPQVLCEALLLGLVLAAWRAYARNLTSQDDWKAGAMAGILVGLVYLCKGTGSLVIGCFGVAALLTYGWRAFARRSLWAFAAALLLTALPLLVYNWTRHGHPLYNFNSQHAMWFDSWDDRYLPSAQWPTMGSYVASHSLSDAVQRLGRGVLAILPVLAEAWSVQGWTWTGWLFAAAGGAAGGWGVWQMIRRSGEEGANEAGLFGLLLIVFVLFFGWFATVTDAPRFFLPLAPLAYLAVFRRARDLIVRWLRGRSRMAAGSPWENLGAARGAYLAGIAVAVLVGAAQPVKALSLTNPFRHDLAANEAAGDVVAWLNGRAGPDGRVLWGPSHELPKWLFVPGLEPDPIPEGIETWDALRTLVRDQGYRYIVLDKKMYTRRRAALEEGFDKNGEVVLFREAPQEWQYAYSRKSEEVNWYILETSERVRPEHSLWSATADFGEATLAKAGIETVSGSGQGQHEVTLVWQTEGTIDQNLTVFVHLLDAAGQRVGQADGYPLGGMYPTSFWKAGERVVDRHTLAPGAPLRDGTYTLLVGLYDGETRQRVPVEQAGGAARIDSEAVSLTVVVADGDALPSRGD